MIDALNTCVAKQANALFFGQRALAQLPAGIDHRLVERAMRLSFPFGLAKICARLAPEYVPLAWRVIARVKAPEATFLRCYEGGEDIARLHTGAAWLLELETSSTAAKLKARCRDATALAAARAAVVAHGAEHGLFVQVLAYDGDDASLDALIPLVHHALSAGGKPLDRLVDLLRPFARGPRLAQILAEVDVAIRTRNAVSPVLSLARQFGERSDRAKLEVSIQSVQVRVALTRKASAWIVLDSSRAPNVVASITWNTYNFQATRWEDGRLVRDKAKVGGPKGLDDLPRWLAASAKKLGVRWDPSTLRVTSSLRGKVREAAVAWLLEPSPSRHR
ncbi:hypothetical protein BH11MYX1_BH11MYX1_55690 [soil metagenome]